MAAMGLYLKLAFGNVRRSARDYSVYFATLGFAACLLYSFVASSDYLNRLDLSPDQMSVVASSGDILQAFSIFTVFVFCSWCAMPTAFCCVAAAASSHCTNLWAWIAAPCHACL